MQKRGMDDARWWSVIDLDSGQIITDVLFADDETGEYDVLLRTTDGDIMRGVDDGNLVIERRQGKIGFQDLRTVSGS